MATGWAGDTAVQDQIDATVEDAVKRARSRLRSGPGLTHCEECDAVIPEARRRAVPGVRLWNAQVAWQVPGLGDSEIALGVNNLADTRWYTRNVDGNAGRMVAAPRTFYVQGRYRF